jgi:hypothetical protein
LSVIPDFYVIIISVHILFFQIMLSRKEWYFFIFFVTLLNEGMK